MSKALEHLQFHFYATPSLEEVNAFVDEAYRLVSEELDDLEDAIEIMENEKDKVEYELDELKEEIDGIKIEINEAVKITGPMGFGLAFLIEQGRLTEALKMLSDLHRKLELL